ncbi:MAG: LEA type 2 family protein [Archaeoglobus sp.]|nr:LEA type 2 family protein [Archaeoglobus sp.]
MGENLRLSVIFIVTLIVIALLGCFGLKLGEPEIKSINHEWGKITDKTTEIVTTVVAYNPNPVPIPIKEIEAELYMNGIKMGEGKNAVAELKPREQTEIKLSTVIENPKIPEWWVSHLKNGEKSEVVLRGKIVFDLKVTEFSWPFEQRSVIKTSIVSSMNYEKLPLAIGPIRIYSSMTTKLGDINETRTEFIHEAVFSNPYAFPIPLTRIDYTIWMNGIKIGEGSTKKSLWLPAKSDTKLTFTTEIDNMKLAEWWVSHLRNGESSVVRVEIMPTIEVLGQSFRFTLLEEEVEFKTNILGGSL